MIGNKKLSEIREELREAAGNSGINPIAALELQIRKMKKRPMSAQQGLRSLILVRDALARAAEKAANLHRSPRRTRTKKAV